MRTRVPTLFLPCISPTHRLGMVHLVLIIISVVNSVCVLATGLHFLAWWLIWICLCLCTNNDSILPIEGNKLTRNSITPIYLDSCLSGRIRPLKIYYFATDKSFPPAMTFREHTLMTNPNRKTVVSL